MASDRKMLKLCGETEERLAQELIQFEFQIERDVVEPLCVIAEVRRHLPGTLKVQLLPSSRPHDPSGCFRQVDIPNIQKQRKHLAKLVLDMDSSRTRCSKRPRLETSASDFKQLNLPSSCPPTDISSRQNRPATRARCSLARSPSLSERRWRRQPIGWRFAG